MHVRSHFSMMRVRSHLFTCQVTQVRMMYVRSHFPTRHVMHVRSLFLKTPIWFFRFVAPLLLLAVHHMSLIGMSLADLKERLQTQHGEQAPKNWGKTQCQLRLVELEGEEIMCQAPKVTSPLREMEVQINKMARRKSDLQGYMTNTLGVRISGQETIEQLKLKALTRAYQVTPGHSQDYLGFGQYSHLTYEDVRQDYPDYVKWAVTQSKEGSVSPKMERFLKWLEANPEGNHMMPKAAKSQKSKPAGSQDGDLNNTVRLLAKSVQQMSAEIKEIKENQQGRRKITTSSKDGNTSSEWEAMTDTAAQ